MSISSAVKEVTEGQAKCETPESVFYNPVQEYNRDLTIAVIKEHAKTHIAKSDEAKKYDLKKKGSHSTNIDEGVSGNFEASDVNLLEAGKYYENGIRVLEGLAASGLRSIRFGLEIPGVKEIIANDFDKSSVEFIDRNIIKNNLSHIVKSSHGDAAMVMYEHKTPAKRFDVIDLDPYGGAHPFIDSAVQSVSEGGLLCVTCTDAAVLCGKAPEKCHSNYGAISLNAPFQHEMGIRTILQTLDSHANRYSRYIVPLLSLSIDFYFRVFVRVFTSPKMVKKSCLKKSMVYSCVGCNSFYVQPLAQAEPTRGEGNFKYMAGIGPPMVGQQCDQCGKSYRLGGPMWSAPLHDRDFVKSVLNQVATNPTPPATQKRIIGMLSVAMEELPDVPLYYFQDRLCGALHIQPPRTEIFRSAFFNAGFRVSMSHAKKNSIKTDAPPQFVWDVMREWIKTNPLNPKRLKEDVVMKALSEKPQKYTICFDEHPDANPESRKANLKRFAPNPQPNWGPKPKASRIIPKEDILSEEPQHSDQQDKKDTTEDPQTVIT